MRKLRSLTGLPVVCGKRRIGRVLRGELTEDLRQLKGIWVYAGMRGNRFIPAEHLELLGKVAVMADSDGKRGRMTSQALFMRATATDGTRAGAITGAEIDEISFAVTALELSAGFWDDLLHGRGLVTHFTVNCQSGEVIIEPAGVERGEIANEGRIDQGIDRRDADRQLCGDDVWRHELEDRAQLEPQSQANGQLDL